MGTMYALVSTSGTVRANAGSVGTSRGQAARFNTPPTRAGASAKLWRAGTLLHTDKMIATCLCRGLLGDSVSAYAFRTAHAVTTRITSVRACPRTIGSAAVITVSTSRTAAVAMSGPGVRHLVRVAYRAAYPIAYAVRTTTTWRRALSAQRVRSASWGLTARRSRSAIPIPRDSETAWCQSPTATQRCVCKTAART